MKFDRVPPNSPVTRRQRKRTLVTASLLEIIEKETEINMHTLMDKVKLATRYELHSNVVGHYLIKAVKDGIVHRKHKRISYKMEVIYCWGPETPPQTPESDSEEAETDGNGHRVK